MSERRPRSATILDDLQRERLAEAGRRVGLRFASLVHSLKTYDLDHPSMDAGLGGVADALGELQDILGSFSVAFEDNGLLVEGSLVELDVGAHPLYREVLPWLRRRGATGLRVGGEIRIEDVRILLKACLAVGQLGPSEAREAVQAEVLGQGQGHLGLLGGAESVVPRDDATDPAERILGAFLELAEAGEELLVEGLRAGTGARLARACEQLVGLLPGQLALVPPLLELGGRFTYEARHVANVATLGLGLGARLGLERDALLDLVRSLAEMDAGMVVLPVELRRAAREFSAGEQQVMQTHPIESVRIQLAGRDLSLGQRRRIRVAFEQHLGVHRDGYPEVLYWPRPHLFSRIAAVCDVYDALTSNTPWRRALAPSRALAQMAQTGRKSLDLVLVAELCALLGEFPDGCGVRLGSGQLAAIVEARGPGGLPRVRLLGGESAGQVLDLAERDAQGRLRNTIQEVLLSERASLA